MEFYIGLAICRESTTIPENVGFIVAIYVSTSFRPAEIQAHHCACFIIF